VFKVGTPNSTSDLKLSQLLTSIITALTPIVAQNLEYWVHIDHDDLNKINICSLLSFRTSTKKTLNHCNFCIQYPNYAFFSALESSCICLSVSKNIPTLIKENMHTSQKWQFNLKGLEGSPNPPNCQKVL
jgi:hypothetical protein